MEKQNKKTVRKHMKFTLPSKSNNLEDKHNIYIVALTDVTSNKRKQKKNIKFVHLYVTFR